MNGGTKLNYYNYTTEVNNLHIIYLLFVVSVILHLDANLFVYHYC